MKTIATAAIRCTVQVAILDVGEANDLAAQHSDVVKSLTAKALDWAKSLPSSPGRAAAEKTGQSQGRKTVTKPATKQDEAAGTHDINNGKK